MVTNRLQIIWPNYSNQLITRFGDLLQRQVFVDVTLVCDTGSLKAHRSVLSACSPYFEQLLLGELGANPVIIFKGMQHSVLHSLVDFMYRGETNLPEEHLPSFLEAAKFFEINGFGEMSIPGMSNMVKKLTSDNVCVLTSFTSNKNVAGSFNTSSDSSLSMSSLQLNTVRTAKSITIAGGQLNGIVVDTRSARNRGDSMSDDSSCSSFNGVPRAEESARILLSLAGANSFQICSPIKHHDLSPTPSVQTADSLFSSNEASNSSPIVFSAGDSSSGYGNSPISASNSFLNILPKDNNNHTPKKFDDFGNFGNDNLSLTETAPLLTSLLKQPGPLPQAQCAKDPGVKVVSIGCMPISNAPPLSTVAKTPAVPQSNLRKVKVLKPLEESAVNSVTVPKENFGLNLNNAIFVNIANVPDSLDSFDLQDEEVISLTDGLEKQLMSKSQWPGPNRFRGTKSETVLETIRKEVVKAGPSDPGAVTLYRHNAEGKLEKYVISSEEINRLKVLNERYKSRKSRTTVSETEVPLNVPSEKPVVAKILECKNCNGVPLDEMVLKKLPFKKEGICEDGPNRKSGNANSVDNHVTISDLDQFANENSLDSEFSFDIARSEPREDSGICRTYYSGSLKDDDDSCDIDMMIEEQVPNLGTNRVQPHEDELGECLTMDKTLEEMIFPTDSYQDCNYSNSDHLLDHEYLLFRKSGSAGSSSDSGVSYDIMNDLSDSIEPKNILTSDFSDFGMILDSGPGTSDSADLFGVPYSTNETGAKRKLKTEDASNKKSKFLLDGEECLIEEIVFDELQT